MPSRDAGGAVVLGGGRGLFWQQGGNRELRGRGRNISAFLQQLWLSAPPAAAHRGPTFGFLVSCKTQELGRVVLLPVRALMWDLWLPLLVLQKDTSHCPQRFPKPGCLTCFSGHCSACTTSTSCAAPDLPLPPDFSLDSSGGIAWPCLPHVCNWGSLQIHEGPLLCAGHVLRASKRSLWLHPTSWELSAAPAAVPLPPACWGCPSSS